jgi:hypothetical protein
MGNIAMPPQTGIKGTIQQVMILLRHSHWRMFGLIVRVKKARLDTLRTISLQAGLFGYVVRAVLLTRLLPRRQAQHSVCSAISLSNSYAMTEMSLFLRICQAMKSCIDNVL